MGYTRDHTRWLVYSEPSVNSDGDRLIITRYWEVQPGDDQRHLGPANLLMLVKSLSYHVNHPLSPIKRRISSHPSTVLTVALRKNRPTPPESPRL